MKLRKLKEKDADGMLEWMHDPEIQKNFQIAMRSKEKKDILEFIKKAEVVPIQNESIHYAIANEQDEYLGTISLKNIDMISRNAEYAISLRQKAQGRGIAAKATKELLNIAFKELDLERVYLNVLSENIRAIHLYEKCGFIYEGEFRKHLLLEGEFKTLKWYGILKEEFIFEGGGISKSYTFPKAVVTKMQITDIYLMEVA